MSRHGYTDDFGCDDYWELIRFRGALASAVRGQRGQAMLRELLTALDEMPVKELITEDLEDSEGQVCALGCLGKKRGLDMQQIDPEEPDRVAEAFGVAEKLVREIAYQNDDCDVPKFERREDGGWTRHNETAAQRWARMRKWVAEQIKAERSTTEASA